MVRIKVGDRWYDMRDGPIMVELSEVDKKNIKNMNPECSRYAEFTDEYNDAYLQKLLEWMDEGAQKERPGEIVEG